MVKSQRLEAALCSRVSMKMSLKESPATGSAPPAWSRLSCHCGSQLITAHFSSVPPWGFSLCFTMKALKTDVFFLLFFLQRSRRFLQLEATSVWFFAPFLLFIFFSEFRRKSLWKYSEVSGGPTDYFNNVRVKLLRRTPNYWDARIDFMMKDCEKKLQQVKH